MRSAWLKWARAIEHQSYLARLGREFAAGGPTHTYRRTDNCSDHSDELLRVEWRLQVVRAYPERWGIVLGDAVGNLRAALDHAMFAAAQAHSGPPAKPESIYFPIKTDATGFGKVRRELKPLVSDRTWEVVEALQPYHGGAEAHTDPLAIVQWMSNFDKHRALHVVGLAHISLDLPLVADGPGGAMEVVEQETIEGQVEDGALIGRATIRRPSESGTVDLTPTFAHTASVQICDKPAIEYRTLDSVMDAMTDGVLRAIHAVAAVNGFELPDTDELEIGREHAEHAPEYAGTVATYQDLSGTRHTFQVPPDPK